MSPLCAQTEPRTFRSFFTVSQSRVQPARRTDRHRLIRQLAWPLLIGWSIRLAVAGCVYKTFLNPARDHWEFGYELGHLARSIATGQGFANPFWGHTGPSTLLTPVYPYLLAAIFVIFGVFTKASAWALLSFNTFFSALTAIPVFFIARKTVSLQAANRAAWVWAFFPYSINLAATTLWYHCFLAFLLAVIFLTALFLQSDDRLWPWLGFGALFGLAALTNPVIVGIAPPIGLWLMFRLARRQRRWFRSGAAGMLAMVMVILPWPARNLAVLHQGVPFKDGFWLEVCVGNVNNSLHWWDAEEHPSGSKLEAIRFKNMGEIDYMAAKRSKAFSYIHADRGQYAWRTLRHIVFMWTGFWSLKHDYLRLEPLDPENILMATGLSVLAFAGLMRLVRNGRPESGAGLYVLVLLLFPVPYYLSHLDPGFRHPLDPLLVVLACSALPQPISRRSLMPRAVEEEAKLAFQ